MTDRCKNITLATTSLRPVTNCDRLLPNARVKSHWAFLCNYRRLRSCAKVMFSQVSVILFTGGCIPACTGADTPPGQTYPSMHWGRHLTGRPFPPPPTATAADGTHPTGMLSCYVCFRLDLSYGIRNVWKPISLWHEERRRKSLCKKSVLNKEIRRTNFSFLTRMHTSGMRTDGLLTVSEHALWPGGCTCPGEGCTCPGTPPPWTEWLTDRCKNITFANFVCGR